jgi:ketosteroid isomerase-like protein
VRHTLDADTNDNGKTGTVHLKVLLVWLKEGGEWKLLVRQAVKEPAPATAK